MDATVRHGLRSTARAILGGHRDLEPFVRIAWLGPAPHDRGGVATVAKHLIGGLAARGVEVDSFVVASRRELPAELMTAEKVRMIVVEPVWPFGDWYEPPAVATFLISQAFRAAAQARLLSSLLRHHRARPYDLLYQFSQLELFGVRRHLEGLPPIVLHPQVHAQGELRWHRRETDLSRRCEPLTRRLSVRAMLTARARLQRRDVRLARRLVVASARFGEILSCDYSVPSERLVVVPNPVDLDRFHPRSTPAPGPPIRLLFVSRIAVRKGVDLIVELSHRLCDLEGRVVIDIVGAGGDWTDYRPLLANAQPWVARYVGEVDAPTLAGMYRQAHALLAPSRFEPFGLTVAEALASGLPVVLSDEVGAAESLDPRCCRRFPDGDVDGFERAVRTLIRELTISDPGLRALAQDEARRQFSIDVVVPRLIAALDEAVSNNRA